MTQTCTPEAPDTLQPGDVVQDSYGWYFRVRTDGRYDAFSEFDGTTTPVRFEDAVEWPVFLLARDGKPAEGADPKTAKLALFLDARR